MVQQENKTRAPAPAVTLKAIGHGRKLDINNMGMPTVLLFVARETSEQASPVVNAIRESYPTAQDVTIVNVADGRPFPKLIRKIAEQIMKSSYKNAVDNLAPGRTPEEYVLIAPDWDGDVLNALQIEDVSKQVAIAVIDREGNVVGTYQGDDPASEAVRLLGDA